MDNLLTEEQLELRDEVAEFCKLHLNNQRYFEEFSYDMWRRTAEFGILGITADRKYGGLEESYTTAAALLETMGYHCRNSGFLFAISNHLWVAQNLIGIYGSEYLKDKYLADMIGGKLIGGLAITEADAGSDAANMSTYAEECEGGYRLNGNKIFISNGSLADVLVVIAKSNKNSDKLTAFVVDKTCEGFKAGEEINKMGLKACPASEIIFSDCKIPKENVLGKVDQGLTMINKAMEYERCFEFAPQIGVMQRVMEECARYSKSRVQYGRPIGENQSISHMIAEMAVSIELSRLLLYKIASLKDRKKSAFKEASIFKLFVSENYIKTCRNAMQIFGAYGYTKEYGIERELRDALSSSIYGGTNEIQKNIIYAMTAAEY